MKLSDAAKLAADRQIAAMSGGRTTDPAEIDPAELSENSADAIAAVAAIADVSAEELSDLLKRADGAAGRMIHDHAEEAGHPGQICLDIVRQIIAAAVADTLIIGAILGRSQGADAGSSLSAELADLPTIEPGETA